MKRTQRADVLAVAVLVALPAVVFGVPALLGHPVMPGDDLIQNYPLRVLAGRQIRAGHLPLFDPYIWGGTQLLAGWNAGAAYPLTLLFAVLPGVAAWTLNLIATWAVAAAGMFCFLRALRLRTVPSALGALTFAFAGAMPAQLGHLGLVAGMSWVPAGLLAILRLTQARGMAARLGWAAVLAGAVGLTILAGEPRAIDDAGVILVCYAAWRVAGLGRRCVPAAGCVAAGLALGACLGAVQWLPGLAAVSTSQRAAGSVALFNSGSLPAKWLLLLVVPNLLGGSGSFSEPAFFAHYNLTEVTGYAGILPLIAAAVLLGRFRLRPRPPEWIVWHVIGLVGVVLALGGNTPAGHLLVHVPLFGNQRLQSRNILVTDLALPVLLAYWADQPFSERSRRFLRTHVGRRIDLETALGLVPALAMIAVVALGLSQDAGLLHWLLGRGADAAHAARADGSRLKPWLVPYALIGAGAAALVIFGRRLPPRLHSRVVAGFVIADVVVFTLLGVVAAFRGPGTAAATTSAPGQAARILRGYSEGRPAARPVAALGYPGRFAIYDPGQLDSGQLSLLGAPDLNVISGTPSAQGYSSLVDGIYAAATGSHKATGEGQNVLSPGAVARGVLGQLDTSILLTVPAYLVTTAGAAGPPAGPPGAGHRYVTPGHQASWYFGTPIEVSRVDVPDADAVKDAAAGMRLGLVTPGGATRWVPARAASGSQLAATLAGPVTSVALVAQARREPAHLGAPSVVDSGGSVFVADGQMQNALVPPRWGLAGHDGSFAVFADRAATGPLRTEALAGGPAPGASVRRVAGLAVDPSAAAVRSRHGVRVVRAVVAIPGWTATWHPRHGQPARLAVRRDGLVQSVRVPPGNGVVTWTYTAPGFTVGITLSLGSAALIVLTLAACWRWRRPGAAEPAEIAAAPSPSQRTRQTVTAATTLGHPVS